MPLLAAAGRTLRGGEQCTMTAREVFPSPSREAAVERAFVALVRRGLPLALVRKLNGMGYRSWPDRMVLAHGVCVFVELKRPGGRGAVSAAQRHLHEQLRLAGFHTIVADDAESAYLALRGIVLAATTSQGAEPRTGSIVDVRVSRP